VFSQIADIFGGSVARYLTQQITGKVVTNFDVLQHISQGTLERAIYLKMEGLT